MQRLIFFSSILFFYNSVAAQWTVSTISDSLLENSNIVVRRHASEIKIFDANKIFVAENFVVTILDNNVLNHFRFYSILSDSLIEESLESKVFDVNGKRIKQARAKVFQSGISKNNGSMLKLFSPIGLSFPLTVELEYKKEIKSIKDIHSWKPVIDFGVSIQNASLKLTVSDTSSIVFQSNKITLTDRYINEDGLNVFLWELINFPSIKKGNSLELLLNDLPTLKLMSR